MEFWKILLDDIKEPVSYLPMGVGAAIMMLLLLRLVAGEKAWKRPQVYYYFLLGVYETVVWIQAFFSRESGSRTGIDWQLFETWGRTWQSRAYMVENVIMFLPLGVLLPLAERRCAKWWKMLLISMLLSMMIEGMQLVTERGYCQLDDVVMNTLGGCLGYGVMRIIDAVHRRLHHSYRAAVFVSRLWQIHILEEGNTRTTAVFFIKYLRTLGFSATNDIFAENAWYFRNALVRANYTNLQKGMRCLEEVQLWSFLS